MPTRPATGQPQGGRRTDALVVLALLVLVVGVEYAVRGAALRPLWYDELWRGHYLSTPFDSFWSELRLANAPSPLGWAVVSRSAGALLGWRAYAVRLPELLTLPLLAAGMYGLARRFTGPVTAAGAAVLVAGSGTVVDLGTQFKPYTVEALCALGVLALWLSRPAGDGTTGARLAHRSLAGALTLFTVPLAFLVGPLAAADVLFVRGGWRARVRAGVEAAPAVLLSGAHTLLFVGHQAHQREGDYWNGQFLAGRNLLGGLRFIGHQLLLVASSTPPGVDRTDTNLVHAVTDGTVLGTWVLAPAYAVASVLGSRVLLRRRDGRVVLVALLGAELVELVASAARYWPFGATRTNLFLVPLLTLVPAVGIGHLAGRARQHRRLVAPASVLLGVTVFALLSALSATRLLYRHQHDGRLLDQTGAAAGAAQRLFRPGDLMLVAGRYVRPAWSFAMDVQRPAGQRIPEAETAFVVGAAGLPPRTRPPSRVLLFVLDEEAAVQRDELVRLQASGYCPVRSLHFALTGQLTVLDPC